MNVLVVGGTGVLGHELAEALVADGHATWILSNGAGPGPVPKGTAGHLVADRNDQRSLAAAFAGHAQGWDLVIDSACYDAGHAGRLLEALEGRARRFIVISTTFVYSDGSRLPAKENTAGRAAELGGYAGQKLLAEQAWVESGRMVDILRLPHVIAQGCAPGAVPLHNRDSQLVTRLKKGWPVWLVDEGREPMQFIDGRDAGQAVCRLAGRAGQGARIFNCAHAPAVTGREYVEILAGLLGVTPQFRNVPGRLHRMSGWGWELSAIPRVCDTAALDDLIGPMSTPLRDSMQRCLAGWISEAPPLHDDFLTPLEAVADDADFLRRLQLLARTRVVTAIDRRMNGGTRPVLHT